LTEIIEDILERAERAKVFREAERHKCFADGSYAQTVTDASAA